MQVFPNYYNNFKCIADKCCHSCCIGWEIDIDEETLATYNALVGEMGDRIRKNIEGETPHFILREGDRCPFLNERGLCDIILNCGEDYLCDICTLHPRFINYYDSFEEVGLGLCCEEAARLILSNKDKFSIDVPENVTEEEKIFLEKRQNIFSILQDREKSINERFKHLADKFELKTDLSLNKIVDIYLSLERLDDKWTERLNDLKNFSFNANFSDELFFEQLAVYFIFRHLEGAMWDDDFRSRIGFSLLSCYLIAAICAKRRENLYDIARMYSCEIEYSEENTEALLNLFLTYTLLK